MAQDYSPSLVTKNLVFCGDAAMKSAAGPATLLYDKVNDNNGTMYNGSCADFDGTDDYIDCGTPSSLDSLSAFTISFWFQLDSLATDHNLISKGLYSSAYSFFIQARPSQAPGVNKSYHARLTTDGSTSTVINSAQTTWTTSDWYHLVLVYTGSEAGYYINGDQLGAFTAFSGTVGPGATSETLKIGRLEGNESKDTNGKIADVRIYNVALSAGNAKELYDDSKVIIPTKNDASGGFVSQTNLIAWWPLVDGGTSNLIAYDGSGYGNHGTLTNMDAATDWLSGQTGCPQLVGGYNRKFYFSGDDYVNCGTDSSLNFTTGNFSVSYWVYIHDITDIGYLVKRGAWGTDGWYTYLESSGRISIYTNDDGQGDPHTYTVSNSSVITENTWHHVVVVRNGATGIIYVDGTDETASGDSMIDPKSTGSGCYIGSPTNFISGIVDEVIVYDTVVTSSQAAALHATDANGGPLPPDPMSGASNLPSTSNVVSYWRNDGLGTWTDRGNNTNDGTPVGTFGSVLLFKQGINGQKNVNTGRDNQGFPLLYKNVGAIGFNGSTDYTKVLAQSVPELDDIFDGGGTASAWIYAASDGETSYGRILHKRSAGLGWFIECRDESGGFIRIRFQQEFNTTDGRWETAVDVPINQWVYVCVTYDSDSVSNDATIYINGVSNSSESQTPVGTRGTDAAQHLYIGNRGANDYTFDGQIANAQLYNRALTYAEIQQNYNSFKNRFGK